uniref:Uncharacterized protein n=1 Tax=Octopus bimaculoides TaxID=37653 RepID=A0A0L8GMN8_OCTBM
MMHSCVFMCIWVHEYMYISCSLYGCVRILLFLHIQTYVWETRTCVQICRLIYTCIFVIISYNACIDVCE